MAGHTARVTRFENEALNLTFLKNKKFKNNLVEKIIKKPYETYLKGKKFGGFSKKIPIFSDYQNLGHRHYFPQITFHVFC